jgi:hypothetical protein
MTNRVVYVTNKMGRDPWKHTKTGKKDSITTVFRNIRVVSCSRKKLSTKQIF